MARIAYLSKYPPLEGGISAKTYWLTRALADRGHSVTIITDPVDVDLLHSIPNVNLPDYPSIEVYRYQVHIPWHIPPDQHRAVSLLNTTLKIIEANHSEVIVAGYLVPYGIVAHLASRLTGVPYVLLHGGSDLNKFVIPGIWSTLWERVLSHASHIITDADHTTLFKDYNNRIISCPPYVPDPHNFRPKPDKTSSRPRLAIIGKANYHWEHKGWDRVIEIWEHLVDHCELVIVSQGNGLSALRDSLSSRLRSQITWSSFVSPWEMPSLLRSIDGIFYFLNELPHPMFSNLVCETLCCGGALIADRHNPVEDLVRLGILHEDGFEWGLQVENGNPDAAAKSILSYFQRTPEVNRVDVTTAFQIYVSSHEQAIIPPGLLI